MNEINEVLIDEDVSAISQRLSNGSVVTFANIGFASCGDGLELCEYHPSFSFDQSGSPSVGSLVRSGEYGLIDIPVSSVCDSSNILEHRRRSFAHDFNSPSYMESPSSLRMWADWISEARSRYADCGPEFPVPGDRYFGPMYLRQESQASLHVLRIDLRKGVYMHARCHGIAVFEGFLVAYINILSSEGESLALPLICVDIVDVDGLSGVPVGELEIPIFLNEAKHLEYDSGALSFGGRKFGEKLNVEMGELLGNHAGDSLITIPGKVDVVQLKSGIKLLVNSLELSSEVGDVTSLIFSLPGGGWVPVSPLEYSLCAIPSRFVPGSDDNVGEFRDQFRALFNDRSLTDFPYSSSNWKSWLGSSLRPASIDRIEEERIFVFSHGRGANAVRWYSISLHSGERFNVKCHGVAVLDGEFIAYINGHIDDINTALPLLAIPVREVLGINGLSIEELDIMYV